MPCHEHIRFGVVQPFSFRSGFVQTTLVLINDSRAERLLVCNLAEALRAVGTHVKVVL